VGVGRRRLVRIVLEAAVGVGLAVGVAEVVFRIRDHGAFPHVNFYAPDARLGVRLRPGARERLSFSGNPPTTLRTNGLGLRGGELPPPSPDEVVVVGDSQVFGLGVEEDATFSAELGRTLGRPVLNAGVPTYGPAEYVAMTDELLASRPAKTVVFTVNVANDLFEASHPNTERHRVWDGWAVRRETAPASVLAFPGRRWLMAESHLVFALRRWLYGRGPQIDERGFASEGTWTDLVGAGRQAAGAEAERQKRLQKDVLRDAAERGQALVKLGDAESTLERVDPHSLGIDRPADLIYGRELYTARASVGDIVTDRDAEESRSIWITSAMIRAAAAYRLELADRLRQHREHVRSDKARKRLDGQIEALDAWNRSQKELAAMEAQPARFLRHGGPLAAHLAKAKAICDRRGARLVVLVLPLDVQVSPAEWAKYGRPPIDMEPTRVLIDDVLRGADELGVTSLDASAALTAAEPGAFLNGDLHMTAAGHRAVGRALAEAVRSAPPPRYPSGALPAGRTYLYRDWGEGFDYLEEYADEQRSTLGPLECAAHLRNEWVRLFCNDAQGNAVTGIALESGGHGDELVARYPGWAGITAPLLAGERLVATVFWEHRRARVTFSRQSADDRPAIDVRVQPNGKAAEPVSPLADRLCRCKVERGGGAGCLALWAEADPDCARTYGDDCERLIQCALRNPESPPTCPRGLANAGGTGRCFVLCDERHPCANGRRCAPWPDTGICE
jgi:hypothetical protein